MSKVYRRQLVEGVTIPAIIHNGSYFLIDMAVYEDGTVSCWHKSDLQQFRQDLRKGWVVPKIPIGERLSVTHLGSFPVLDARWIYDTQNFYQHVQDVVRRLNPEMANLYRTTQREIQKWEKARVRWSASPTYCKVDAEIGYDLLDGRSYYIFYRQHNGLYLTTLTAYADKTARIDAAGEKFFTAEEIDAFFADGTLCTSLEEHGAWVILDGLGELLLGPTGGKPLSVREKQGEFHTMLAQAAGEEDMLDRCIAAYHAYLTEPGDWAKENLRKAYEAVPEHMRMYLGDMDTRDSDYIRILYHPEQKRQV